MLAAEKQRAGLENHFEPLVDASQDTLLLVRRWVEHERYYPDHRYLQNPLYGHWLLLIMNLD